MGRRLKGGRMIFDVFAVASAVSMLILYFMWQATEVKLRVMRYYNYPTCKTYIYEWAKSLFFTACAVIAIEIAIYGWYLIFDFIFTRIN